MSFQAGAPPQCPVERGTPKAQHSLLVILRRHPRERQSKDLDC